MSSAASGRVEGRHLLKVCRIYPDGRIKAFDTVYFDEFPATREALYALLASKYLWDRSEATQEDTGIFVVPWDPEDDSDDPAVSKDKCADYVNIGMAYDFSKLRGSKKLKDISKAYENGLPSGARIVVVLPPAVTGVPGVARAQVEKDIASITEVVGPAFEDDARKLFASYRNNICKWAQRVDEVSNMHIYSTEGTREADIFAHTVGDTKGACKSFLANGILTIRPGDDASPSPQTPAADPPNLPADRASDVDDGYSMTEGMKYIIGECYSGNRDNTVKEKIVQLETLLEFTLNRFNENYGTVVSDITQIVGCAILAFSSMDRDRQDVISRYIKYIRDAYNKPKAGQPGEFHFTHLRRLIDSRRLVLMVLVNSQCISSYGQRCMARALAGTLKVIDEERYDTGIDIGIA